MNKGLNLHIPDTASILAARPEKNRLSPRHPYAFLCEPERTADGRLEQTATIFLTNRECPFRCLMCDLWKNTLDTSVQQGDLTAQIDYALDRLPPATHLKLYNSGNFFDHKAILPSEYLPIAERLHSFERVIVENHPRLCTNECVWFKDLIEGDLEIAMGLETVHPDVLKKLNKGMTLDDFKTATSFLLRYGIDVRAFILLKPPYMDEQEGIDWALRSIEYAFEQGVHCCAVIPTRPGNGIVDQLEQQGVFSRPSIRSMETVLDEALHLGRGRVFMDLWDIQQFYDCDQCGPTRRDRLHRMNLSQEVEPPVQCTCE